VILALDGSEAAKKAIPVAEEIARMEDGKIVIAHVTEFIVGKSAKVPVRADEAKIKAEIEKQAEELRGRGTEATVDIADNVLGGPAHAIVDIADRNDGDLIITGTRGHGAVAGVLLGSVAHRLLHIADRPTLTVPA
jgi:nucleotide-binding universal stress UspA family protein